MKKSIIAMAMLIVFVLPLVACSSEADVATENVKKAAEQFEVTRRITGINGITDTVFLKAEGKCSFEAQPAYYDVICKTPEGEFLRHVIAKSDNTAFVVEQLTAIEASTSQYRFIVRPSALIPDIDLQ